MKRGLQRGDKSGQFYMIAAIIMAAVIIGIVAITNYSRQDSNQRIYDIRDEIQIETSNVLDYSINNPTTDIRQQQENFVRDYISYRNEGNFYFVFGQQGAVTLIAWQQNSEPASVVIDSQETEIDITPGQIFEQDFTPAENVVTLKVRDSNHDFQIKQGENFYFVISQSSDSGGYIVSG